MSENDLPRHAEIVVVGGGILGCSTAYHLSKLGINDVIVIERDILTSGTTWHAAGVVGSLRASVLLTELTMEAVHLFPTLEQETGQSTGYRRTGGLSIAQTQERLEELKRIPAIGVLTKLEAELLTPSDVREKSPNLNVDDISGGVWIPMDGQTNPTDTTIALSKGARSRGARFFEKTEMVALKRRGRSIIEISTTRGPVTADWIILCCGMWTRHIANSINVAVPLQAAEHMYVVTEPMDDVPIDQPFIRDFDSSIYIKGDAGKLLIGSIDPVSKPWCVPGIPAGSAFSVLPEDWDHFEPFMKAALNRIPSLKHVGIRQFFNGPESFTADSKHILGIAPGYNNLFIAAGFNTTGIMTSAGAGMCIAQWIVNGYPSMDMWEVDPRRFERWQSTDAYIGARTYESPGLAFAMHWPHRQPKTARNVKKSTLHNSLAKCGACFGVVAGWEKPLWYTPQDRTPKIKYSFGQQHWWPYSAAEVKALTNNVVIFDQSQMTIFELEGPDVTNFLQRICANNVSRKIGQVIYSQMLNNRGGIECDVTVTRLQQDKYRIVTGATNKVRDHDWIDSQIKYEKLSIEDVSSSYGILMLMGPKSRSLLSSLVPASLENSDFPFGTMIQTEIGYAMLEIQRLSYVGELGFELYVPMEAIQHVYDTLITRGESYHLQHAGILSMDSCRIEKGYRHWGHELTPSVTPLEAGLEFAVDFTKNFTGREALTSQKTSGLTRHLMMFQISTGEPLLLHDEPIYANGDLVGETTSGAKSFRVGGHLAFGFIRHPNGETRSQLLKRQYQIQIGNQTYPAKILARAPYDHKGERMRL